MNPDQNQPQDPTQTPAEVPATPVETPTPAEPAVTTPNPFGGSTPVSSETPAATSLGSQPSAIGSSPSSAPVSSAPQPSKKKLIILISAIVGGLIVLGGIALAVYLLFFSVTKADYKQAYDQLQTVQTAVSSTSLNGEAASLSTSFDEFKTANAKLGDLKALKADKDLNVLYKAYDAKAKEYITFMDGFIPSYEKLKTVTDTMSGSTSMLKSASVQATIDSLESASDATNPAIKAYVDSLLVAYKEILPQAKIYEASTSSSSARLAAITAISKSTKTLSTASTKFSTDVKASYDGVSPKDTFDALSKAVTAKYNKK